jgi:hypothetical protein
MNKSDEQQRIGTGQVIELNGKYWGRNINDMYATWVDLMNATIYNNELSVTTDVVMDNHDEYENLSKATLLPIKQITTRQVGEF